MKLTNREEYGIERPKASSESLSLRLNRAILNDIRKEARQKGIIVNTLLNQITKQHVQWHSHAATAGFVTVRKQLIMKLINRLDEAEISNIAKEISTGSKDFVLLLRSEYQLESVLDVIQTCIRISGYKYKSEVRGASQLYIVQHDMGKNGLFIWQNCIDIYLRNLKSEKSISIRLRIRYPFAYMLIGRHPINSIQATQFILIRYNKKYGLNF